MRSYASQAKGENDSGNVPCQKRALVPQGDQIASDINSSPVSIAQRKAVEGFTQSLYAVHQKKSFEGLRQSVSPNQLHMPSDPHVLQRVVIGGYNKGNNMNLSKVSLLEDQVKEWAIGIWGGDGWDRVEYFFRDYFSRDGKRDDTYKFEDLDHFLKALYYDVTTKSNPDLSEPLTAQERWTTEYGWGAREAAGKKSKVAPPSVDGGDPVKLYRTMDVDQFLALHQGDKAALSGHLGDFKQALAYLYGKSSKPKCLVEFSLTEAKMHALFSQIAFPRGLSPSLKKVVKALQVEHPDFVPKGGANQDQGYAKDAVGVKSEKKGEAGFSYGIADGGSAAEKFMSAIGEHFRPIAVSVEGKITWGDGVGAILKQLAKGETTDSSTESSGSSTTTTTSSAKSGEDGTDLKAE